MEKVALSVDHISLHCADAAAAIKFYTEVLGFEETGRIEMPPPRSDLIFLEKDGVKVELSQRDTSAYGSPSVVNHLGFRAEDIHAAYEALAKCELCTVKDEPKKGEYWFFFVEGPAGEQIEVVQPLD